MYLFGKQRNARVSPSLTEIAAPIAWPTAKLLDFALGKSEVPTYKKAELK